jgi:hypothetical protein
MKPNIPMRSSTASHKGRLGITGGILNNIMLERPEFRLFFREEAGAYPNVEPSTHCEEKNVMA